MRPILGKSHDQVYALMRIVVGFLFACHGSQSLFNFPPGEHYDIPLFFLVGKVIELIGGILILAGFLTSIAAFICSGEMAVAYFMAHAKGGFFPIVNKGELAVLFCFVFLFMAAKGSGIWSVDGLLARRRETPLRHIDVDQLPE